MTVIIVVVIVVAAAVGGKSTDHSSHCLWWYLLWARDCSMFFWYVNSWVILRRTHEICTLSLSGFYRDGETETLPRVTQVMNGRAGIYLSSDPQWTPETVCSVEPCMYVPRVGCSADPARESLCVTLQPVLHCQGSTSVDPTTWVSSSAVVHVYWKYLPISGPAQFKPLLFKGPWYCYFLTDGWAVYVDWVFWTEQTGAERVDGRVHQLFWTAVNLKLRNCLFLEFSICYFPMTGNWGKWNQG